ncbi:probable serine/threonine-protein kinase samkC [Portunus trituberculatus]|uniref:probable serine/threonine-protein kinase samkC n=1 Tax=Portunus trituberculatus TaxID=210409 RepID=UPI001E1CF96C|nr:probable serine/threonine-protein kinase samkC [Portunus trituberculatus]XP_045124292.1 probable serine/threonine-protein kinase samkC [Portunus trituberculatus]
MVAPYEVGEPVRSFVRVPTKDLAAKAVCWDLSRASSLVAASAPVRQLLLRAQPQSAQLQDSAGSSPKPSKEQLQAQPKPVEHQPQPQPGDPQAQSQPAKPQAQLQPVEHQTQTQSQPVESQAQSQSVKPQAQAVTPGPTPAAGRQQQLTVTPCEAKRPREEDGGEVSMPQPVPKVARMAGSTGANSSAQPPQCQDKEVQALRRQCQLLQQQNSNLQRRLNLFHGLFQDKQRLRSFVKHLDTLVK